MNESNWQFSTQSQFGVIYDPSDYVIFQAQMLNPDTIVSLKFYVFICDMQSILVVLFFSFMFCKAAFEELFF